MRRDLLPDAAGTVLVAPSAGEAHPWRYVLPLIAGVLVWVLAWHAATGRSMVETWARSQTFTHGFLVVPIVLWLIWRKRSDLARIPPAPAWWALGAFALAGAAWLMGELATVNAVSQLALAALLVSAVLAVLGTAVSRALAFPLAFLFFAVPIGEFITPQLMTWTADFVVAALRMTGVPVYREGLQFVIPSGNWSVVEACSGLRYLVASLMVGTLFAYLTYRSPVRRLVFVGCAFLVPIVANWMRAYLIVMLGHLTNNQLAAGVDHLIYGWIFFGIVIGLMLWIGSWWREDDQPVTPSRAEVDAGRRATDAPPVRYRQLVVVAAAVAGLTLLWKVGLWHLDGGNTSALVRLAPVSVGGDWQIAPQPITRWRPEFKHPSDQLHTVFASGERRVGLIVTYYRNQDQERKLVSSENALERPEDFEWSTVAAGTRHVRIDGRALTVRAAELRGSDGQRLVVWHWYWINGRLTANDFTAKAYTALSRLRGGGDDSAAITLYTPKDVAGGAEAALSAFVQAAVPPLEAALETTRDAR